MRETATIQCTNARHDCAETFSVEYEERPDSIFIAGYAPPKCNHGQVYPNIRKAIETHIATRDEEVPSEPEALVTQEPESDGEPGQGTLEVAERAPVSLSLADLAGEINREHAAAEGAINDALQHARRCGELLIEAKDQQEHGAWGPWLEANFRGSDRTARQYMRIAREWDEIAKRHDRADLTITEARDLIAEPRDTKAEAGSGQGVAPRPPEATEDGPPAEAVSIGQQVEDALQQEAAEAGPVAGTSGGAETGDPSRETASTGAPPAPTDETIEPQAQGAGSAGVTADPTGDSTEAGEPRPPAPDAVDVLEDYIAALARVRWEPVGDVAEAFGALHEADRLGDISWLWLHLDRLAEMRQAAQDAGYWIGDVHEGAHAAESVAV